MLVSISSCITAEICLPNSSVSSTGKLYVPAVSMASGTKRFCCEVCVLSILFGAALFASLLSGAARGGGAHPPSEKMREIEEKKRESEWQGAKSSAEIYVSAI